MDAAVSPSFDTIERRSLVDDRGVRFEDFKRGLKPRYVVVWMELLAGHVSIVLVAGTLVVLERRWPMGWPIFALIGGIALGVAVTYIIEFFHEAAHFNIAKGRRLNDVLANIFIGSLIGQDVRAYRAVHFDHHRYVGTPRDTERTYFEVLDWRFVIESLTGLKVVKVLLARERVASQNEELTGKARKKSSIKLTLVLGLIMHVSILGWAFTQRNWALLFAWPLAMGSVFPFLSALRQLLEHRSLDANDAIDYRVEPHGTVNRMLGTSPLARVFGGAGFNRHLLHHWEPQISYTQFGPLEAFLDRSEARVLLSEHQTTYTAVFKGLFRGRQRAGRRPVDGSAA